MKGLFKLTSVALAVVAFASCSSDDLFHQGETAQQNKGILVEVEDMLDATTTRAAYTPTGKTGKLSWNQYDDIRVTDATMVKYDVYTFDGVSAFLFDKGATGRETPYITAPKYAVFPSTDMQWDNTNLQAYGFFNISRNFAWWEDGETEGAYHAELPLWGTAEADETYGVKTSLKYLTGILKINIDNLPDNATHIRVVGWKNLAGTEQAPMSGWFKAIFATDDVLNEEATLETYGATTYNYINVNVKSASKSQSVLFIPLIAQKYGLLEIEYSKDNGANWTDMKVIENLNVERRKFYNLTHSTFNFGGTTPSAITDVLEEKKGDEEINITMANATQVSSGDYTITLPETSASKITLNFNNLETSDGSALNIVSKGDYAGTLVINVKGTPTITNIKMNLPLTNVVFNDCQKLSGVNLGADAAPDNEANAMVAKTLTINAKTVLGTIYANAELGNRNTDGTADFKMVKGSAVTAVEFETNYKTKSIELCGTLGSDLNMNTWKDKDGKDIKCTALVGDGATIGNLTITGDVTVTGGSMGNLVTDGNVTIKGKATKTTTNGIVTSITPLTPTTKATTSIVLEEEGTITNINIPSGSKHTYTLEVKDKASVTGTATVNTLTIAGTTASVANAEVSGDATITDTEEAVAITGYLSMKEGQTLNYNGGYINEIKVVDVDKASGKGKKALTIKHGTAAYFTAINTITPATNADYKFDTTTKSVWNGKKIDAKKFAAYTTPTTIYTANQLATSYAAGLMSNIDLAGLAYNGPALAGNFTGMDMDPVTDKDQLPTIENLNLAITAAKGKSIEGAGLFSTASTDATLQNFTVKNVTSSAAGAGTVKYVGALVGNASAAITVKNVAINTAAVGNLGADYVGGLIGNTTKDITLEKVTVTDLTLNGHFYIGGVVGESTGTAITISDKTTLDVDAINVPDAFNAEPDIKTLAQESKGYGSVGMIAGQSGVEITHNDKLTVNDLITGNRQRLGYKMYYKDAGPDVKYYYGRRGDDHTNIHVYVGRITGDFSSLVNVTAQSTFTDGWKNAKQCMLIKHTLYANCDK